MDALSRFLFALFLALLSATLPASGLDLGARDVLVPVVGRVPGANGSMWRTDLVVTNVTRPPMPVTAFLEFHSNDGRVAWEAVQLGVRESLVLKDVVGTRFDTERGSGYVRVVTSQPNAQVTAQARIYNVGAMHGEYGQSVPGLPTDALTRDHSVVALDGTAGNRTNLGITNPWNVEVTALVELYDAGGVSRASRSLAVPREHVLQINDVFSYFGVAPIAGAMVRISTNVSVSAWASIIRNDSGDSTFVTGTGLSTGNERLAAPQCTDPAPVNFAAPGTEPGEGWIVIYEAGTNSHAVTAALAAAIGFTPRHVYDAAFPGFAADLTETQIARLRCQTEVKLIEQNVLVPIP